MDDDKRFHRASLNHGLRNSRKPPELPLAEGIDDAGTQEPRVL